MPTIDEQVDEYFSQRESEGRTQSLINIRAADGSNPDQVGKGVTAARKAALPLPMAVRNPEWAQKTFEKQQTEAILADYPGIGAVLAESPWAARLAADDLPLLSEVYKAPYLNPPRATMGSEGFKEASKRFLEAQAQHSLATDRYLDKRVGSIRAGRPAPGITDFLSAGYHRASAGLYGVAETAMDLVADPIRSIGSETLTESTSALLGIADYFADKRQEENQYADYRTRGSDQLSWLGRAAGSGFESIGGNVINMVTALVNPALGLSLMAGQVGGLSVGAGKDKGLDLTRRTVYGASDAAVEYWTERWPLFKLLNDVKMGAPVWKTVLRQLAPEQVQEQGATLLQDLNEWAALNPDKPFVEYLRERPERARDTAIATLVATLVQTGAVASVGKAVGIANVELEKKQVADTTRQMLSDLGTLAEKSKTFARDPGTFGDFVEKAAPGNEVFIDANTLVEVLRQDGIDIADFAASMPSVQEQLQEALATGGDVIIPLKEYLQSTTGTPLAQSLLSHVRPFEDALSANELTAAEGLSGKDLTAEVEKIMAAEEQDSVFTKSAERLTTLLGDNLVKTGKYSKAKAKAQVAPLANFYTVLASKLDVTPEDMFKRYPLEIGTTPLTEALSASVDAGADGGIDSQEAGPAGASQGQEPASAGASQGQEASRQLLSAEGLPTRALPPSRWRKILGDTLPDVAQLADEKGVFDRLPEDKPVHRDDIARELYHQAALGQISFGANMQPTTLALLEKADLSTFLHETGHFFFEVYRDLATKIQERQRAGETLTPGEQSILDDMNALIRFVGTTKTDGSKNGPLNQSAPTITVDGVERPRNNSNGKPIAQTDEGLRNFYAWFKDSKVVDDQGRPLVVYRGDTVQRDVIDPQGGMIWLAENHSYAEGFSGAGGDVSALYAAISNPFDAAQFGSDEMTLDEWAGALNGDGVNVSNTNFVGWAPDYGLYTFYDLLPHAGNNYLNGVDSELISALKNSGFDGIEAPDENAVGVDSGRVFVAFDSTKIKSATGNTGAFSPDNANILEQGGKRGKHFTPKSLDDWNNATFEQRRAGHEKVARAFEAYLFEGKAPSVELESLFAKLRAWLVEKYKTIRALGVHLTDEVRGVFDRMLAVDEVIREAAALRAMAPLYETKPEGMTEDAWLAYQKLGEASIDDAKRVLTARSLREMRWASGARSRVLKALQATADTQRKQIRAEVTAEVDAYPVFAAARWLSRGRATLPDGTEEVSEKGHKLAIPALREMYESLGPEFQPPKWEKLGYGQYGMLANEGTHPDLVAQRFGYDSGDALVRALIGRENRSELIAGLTDKRMLEEHGELADQESLEKAADEALHGEVRAKFVAAELAAADKALGKPTLQRRVAKALANQIIAQQRVRNLRPGRYKTAEARAAKAAQAALKADDIRMVSAQKRNQLINSYAFRAATDAQDEVDSALTYLNKFNKRSKTIDPEYQDQIDKVLERFDLKPRSLREIDKRANLGDWVTSQQAMGLEPVLPDYIVTESQQTHYKNLTVEELRGLVDAVKNIEHLGRLKHKLLTLQDARRFEDIVTAMDTSLRENANRTVAERIERNSPTAAIREGLSDFLATHRKLASLVREIDGGKDGGLWWEVLIQSMNRAGDQEAERRAEVTKALHQVLRPVLSRTKMHQKMLIPSINKSLSREGRLLVALNWGNAGNRQRLMDGDRWSEDQVLGIIQTLTAEELGVVQGVWDYLETFRNEVGAQQKRLTGVEPLWVEPTPFQVVSADGVTVDMRGGYYPAKYDVTRSTRSMSLEAASDVMDMWRGRKGFASTRDGFTKERSAEVVGRPLVKDFGSLLQHLTEVTHRLAWQEWIVDARRLLNNKRLDQALREHYGPAVIKQFRDGLEDIARGETPAQNSWERGLNWVRSGVTVVGLGYSLMTSLLQPLGLTQSMARIGPKWVGKGLTRWLGTPAHMEEVTQWMYAESAFMRNRGATYNREISEIRNKINKGGTRTALEESYFWLIMKAQLVADIPTWLGAYEKAMAGGDNHTRAVALADQAVLDSQGGGATKDLAGIQRGSPALKLWTNFYSYFSVTWNLIADKTRTTDFKSPGAVAQLAVDYLLLTVVPATLAALLREALKGNCDAEDADCLLEKIASENMSYMFGLLIGLREIGAAAGGYNQYTGPTGTRFFAELNRLYTQAEQGEADAAFLKAANSTAGILFHYPAGQVQRTVTGINYMLEEGSANPMPLFVGPPAK